MNAMSARCAVRDGSGVRSARTVPVRTGPLLEQCSFRRVGGQRHRAVELDRGLAMASEFLEEVAAHAREEVVALQSPRRDQLVDQARARPPAPRPSTRRRRG